MVTRPILSAAVLAVRGIPALPESTSVTVFVWSPARICSISPPPEAGRPRSSASASMRTTTRPMSLVTVTGAAGLISMVARAGGPTASIRAVTRGTTASPTMSRRDARRRSIRWS
jgi:hypothetical protein